MASLQEQLLKAGLIDSAKAEKAAQELRKKTHQKTAQAQKKAKKTGEAPIDEAKVLAEKALQEQAERSRALNKLQREQAEQQAIQAQIRQLIQLNRIARSAGTLPYQFADGTTVKSIYVTDKLQDQLIYGLIALVRFNEGYELVPKAVAEKIAQRDASFILVQNTSKANDLADDDPYADYKIPDDLMW